MNIVTIILDFLLGILYLSSGIAAHFDWFDIGLGVAWAMLGGANLFLLRRQRKTRMENISRYTEMCKEINELREKQNHL